MIFVISFNKIKVLLSVCLLIGFSVSFLGLLNTGNVLPVTAPAQQRVVIIDPGHGSIDTGSHYNSLYEKDINLAIAKKIRDNLLLLNLKPIMTRSEDKLYHDSRHDDIRHRPQLIEKYNAYLFISIHVNDYPSSAPSGSQVFYKPGSQASKLLAENVKQELIKIRQKNNRPLQSGSYYVLKQSTVPAVLIETGFISNPTDRELLTDEQYQIQLAAAISRGILNFINET